jgi:hypothetical protein
MGRVNSQRENRPNERENGLRPRNGGQQLKSEKPLISRVFSGEAAAGETVAPSVVGGASSQERTALWTFPVRLGKYREQEEAIGHERRAVVALCQAGGGSS